MMIRKTVLLLLLPLMVIGSATAQETYFGKNKVRYKSFEWQYIQTRHFDVYFYEEAYPTAKFTAEVMESAYVEISNELDYRISKRVPIFLYNSHNDFQQTNITFGLLPEGVGGFTEAFKSRIVIPHTGSYEELRHVLHHELTHAIVYDLIFGGSNLSSLISRQRLFNIPLWYAEGFAEYSSRHGWDYWSDMFVRDATINGYLSPPKYLGNFLAYKQGQAMIKYIADTYGENKLGEILQRGRISLSLDKAMKASIGKNQKELWTDFSRAMKRRYWPEIARRKEAEEIGKPLTRARKDGSFFNSKPVFHPEGEMLAIFTDKSDFTEVVLISAKNGKKIKRLVKSQRSGDVESLHSYVSGLSFSPDGNSMVLVAKSKGMETLIFVDVEKSKIYKRKRLGFHNIVSPVWSPDGARVAFSALEGNDRDLFVYDIETEEIKKLIHDRYDDVEPTWMLDSRSMIFASDRPHPQNPAVDNSGHPYVGEGAYRPGGFDYGTYNLFKIEMENGQITPLDVGPGQNKYPQVSPDGKKIAFISNRNGIDNIYIAFLDTAKYFAITDILSGVTELSWGPDGDRIVFSSFNQGGFDIFLMKDLSPVGEMGLLEPTDFILGNYDKPRKNDETPSETEDSSTVVASIEDADRSATPESDPAMIAAVDDSSSEDESDETADYAAGTEATGVYDDDYVFVSKDSVDALDTLLEVIPYTENFSLTRRKREPAIFDSIPDKLPGGEYKIEDYKVRFTPDFIGGGFAYDTFFGVRGQTVFAFSDYLGNHQIFIATDLVNTIDQSYIQAYYLNNKKRTNIGAGLFHTKNFYLDAVRIPPNDAQAIFSDRFYGLQFFAQRPFSIFSRIEFTASQIFIDRKYVSDGDPRENRSVKVTSGKFGWVFDNVLWGRTGPVNGRRFRVDFDMGVNLFNSKDVEFYAAQFDYRKYWHFNKQFTMAIRFAGGASTGATPKQYFLGGTTNWIGQRTFDATVYDVENLYFSDVVTPLRGVPYYSLSGDRYGLINWEFRFPLIQYFAMKYPLPLVLANIDGAIFTDIGAAWFGDNFKFGTSEGGSRLLDVHTGFGVGVRMNLFGFALLRYDLAWNTDLYTVSKRSTSYFSLGADF